MALDPVRLKQLTDLADSLAKRCDSLLNNASRNDEDPDLEDIDEPEESEEEEELIDPEDDPSRPEQLEAKIEPEAPWYGS